MTQGSLFSPTSIRVLQWPVWAECPWALPDGIEARSDGTTVALVNTKSGKMTGVVRSTFDPKNLPEVLKRVA